MENSRAYVEHLEHEHHRLNKLLLDINKDVEELRNNIRPGVRFEHLTKRFIDLRQELQSHFAEEETGGCLEEAVSRSPSLSETCKTIVAEHAILDRMLERMITQTDDPNAQPFDVQRSFGEFYEKLRAHEAAETRLLQMGFGDASDYNVEEVG